MSAPSPSVCLDTGGLDHSSPFFGFVGDQLSEVDGGHRHRYATEVGEMGLHLRVVESRIDLKVELVDDLGGSAFWRPNTKPGARLIAWHDLAHGRDVRQCL